jgi:hypothetical protein
VLSSNPKAYNLDKMLEYLSHERSVFLVYLIGVKPGGTCKHSFGVDLSAAVAKGNDIAKALVRPKFARCHTI